MANESPESKQILTAEQRNQYRAAIYYSGAAKPCERCGAAFERLGMVGATSQLMLYTIAEAVQGVQERYIPVLTLSCLNCGAIYQHSTLVLDQKVEAMQSAMGATSVDNAGDDVDG